LRLLNELDGPKTTKPIKPLKRELYKKDSQTTNRNNQTPIVSQDNRKNQSDSEE